MLNRRHSSSEGRLKPPWTWPKGEGCKAWAECPSQLWTTTGLALFSLPSRRKKECLLVFQQNWPGWWLVWWQCQPAYYWQAHKVMPAHQNIACIWAPKWEHCAHFPDKQIGGEGPWAIHLKGRNIMTLDFGFWVLVFVFLKSNSKPS